MLRVTSCNTCVYDVCVCPQNATVAAAMDASLSVVREVSVRFSMTMVTLDLHTADVQLLRACASGKKAIL